MAVRHSSNTRNSKFAWEVSLIEALATFSFAYSMAWITLYFASDGSYLIGISNGLRVSGVAGATSSIFGLIGLVVYKRRELTADANTPFFFIEVLSVIITSVLTAFGTFIGILGYTLVTVVLLGSILFGSYCIGDQPLQISSNAGLMGGIAASISTGIVVGGPHVGHSILIGCVGGIVLCFLGIIIFTLLLSVFLEDSAPVPLQVEHASFIRTYSKPFSRIYP